MKNIKEIAIVGEYEDENGVKRPAARVLSQNQDFSFSVVEVSCWAISLFNAFEYAVPEERRGKFSEDFKKCFDKMFEERALYTEIIKQ